MLAFTNRHCYLQALMSKKTSRESTPVKAGLTPRETKFKISFSRQTCQRPPCLIIRLQSYIITAKSLFVIKNKFAFKPFIFAQSIFQ